MARRENIIRAPGESESNPPVRELNRKRRDFQSVTINRTSGRFDKVLQWFLLGPVAAADRMRRVFPQIGCTHDRLDSSFGYLRTPQEAGVDDVLRKPRVDRRDVPQGLPRRFYVSPRPAGGVGHRDRGRLCPGDREAGDRECSHRGGARQRHGQPDHGELEQDAADRDRRAADAGNVVDGALAHERRLNLAAAAMGQMGL